MGVVQFRRKFKIICFCLVCCCQVFFAKAVLRDSDWREVLNLEGRWQFSIGDNKTWSEPDYDDSDWEKIYVPATWEDEGFHGYNGYAWYRTSFKIDSKSIFSSLYLFMGIIDDVDEVYVNGELIGKSGSFPPNYSTAYKAFRSYAIPSGLLFDEKENVIAVRVYDSQLEGGIIHGEIGIFQNMNEFVPLLDLRGIWKFWPNELLGDLVDAKDPETELEESRALYDVIVPSAWEDQGFWALDGIGWYIKSFELPSELKDEDLILVLGKIDDFDEVYVNEQFVGQTNDHGRFGRSTSYRELRMYRVPAEFLNEDKLNIIKVRVEDIGHVGGIYEGPIGFVRP